jgi:hypothetical protein
VTHVIGANVHKHANEMLADGISREDVASEKEDVMPTAWHFRPRLCLSPAVAASSQPNACKKQALRKKIW